MLLAILCIISLVIIFFCSRFVIAEVSSLAGRLHSSRFGVSLVLLGLLTSLTDISVGINAQIHGRPDIFAGNFIGGVFVIIFLVLPFLAILKRGLPLGEHLSHKRIVAFVAVISLPILLVLDGKVQTIDSVLMIAAYCLFLFYETYSKGSKQHMGAMFSKKAGASILKIALCGAIILVSCYFLVEGTEQVAIMFGIPAFIVSVVLLSLGTNVPEISLAITSVLKKKTDVAFGDYIGSASLNTLLLGIFSLLSGPYTIGLDGFRPMLIMFLLGNAIFLWVGYRKRKITVAASFLLIACYGLVLAQQIVSL